MVNVAAGRSEAAPEPDLATSAGTPAWQAAPGLILSAGARSQAAQETVNA